MPDPRHDGGRTARKSRLRLKNHFHPGLRIAPQSLPYPFILLQVEEQDTKQNRNIPTNIQNKSEVVIVEAKGGRKGLLSRAESRI